MQGPERTYITLKGRHKNQTEWVALPASAYRILDQEGVHVMGNSFALWHAGRFELTATMKDGPSTTFAVESAFVEFTDFEMLCPATWNIDKWNGLSNKRIGIREVDMDDKDNGYVLTFSPANASSTGLEWEALDPDVAEFDPIHANGIVPKRDGSARFRVRSTSNPELVREVQVVFSYLNPLAAVNGPSQLRMAVDEEYNLTADLAFSPATATEQRFAYAYSQPGIAEVQHKVNTAPDNVNTPKWTTHTLKGLAEGVVLLTCTPLDLTQGAEPVVIQVFVGDAVCPAAPQPEAIETCGSYTWHGAEYSASGSYHHSVIAPITGCQSTETLHLTIHQPTSGDTTATAEDSFAWYGAVHTASGNYQHTLTAANGCDSVVTLHLTIKPSQPDQPSGLFDTKLTALTLHPNPTSGELWLAVPELVEGTIEGTASAEVRVYNAKGQLVLCVPTHGASAGSAPAVAGSAPAAGRIRIDLNGLPSGLYIIRVGIATAKVVLL